MGISEINNLKTTAINPAFEQLPNGAHEVPLKSPSGETIGEAAVTIKNGVWTANLKLTTEAAKALGMATSLIHTTFHNGEQLELHAYPRTDAEWVEASGTWRVKPNVPKKENES